MAWVPSEKELVAVLELDDAKRYSYCIKKFADERILWGLWKENGWAVFGDDLGREVVPVWPHARYAALCAIDELAGYTPKQIPLDPWLERWLPGMEKDGRLAAVFATPKKRAVVVPPSRMGMDLREELANYE